MLKKILILTMILAISGSAAYSLNSLKFFETLGMVFQETGPSPERGYAGQRLHGHPGRPGGRGAYSLSQGLLQFGAYLSVFACVVMLTDYADRLLKKPPLKKKQSGSIQRDYCKSMIRSIENHKI